MPVAPVTRTPIAVLYRNGRAESIATAMPAYTGVRKTGLAAPQALPNGRRPSRPIDNIRRIVADWIARVHTQTAMKTDPRNTLPQELPSASLIIAARACVKVAPLAMPSIAPRFLIEM